MAYFTSLWKARIIEKCKREYEDEKINSILASNTKIPRKTTSVMQKWRIYRRDTKTRMAGKLKKWFPEGSSASNLYYYLKTDQTFPNFVLKSVVGFLGGIVLTYLCFMFFVFQLSISLIHATIMSSVIGVLLTLGLAFSYRIRCLVFLLIPQLFSRVGRYTLTCYALVLILTGPATNTFKNSEVLSESMACSQEQIKTSVRQINESMKKPFNAMKDSIKLMVETIKRLTSTLNEIISRISVLATSISDVIQSSLSWLNSVGDICNKKFGTPYDYCMKAVNRGVLNCRDTFKGDLSWLCTASSASAKSACMTVKPYNSVCFIADYSTTSFAATMRRKLKIFTDRINRMFFINVEIQHTYTFTSNTSESASQVAAGIVTEIRNRADPLLTWLSWSSCATSLFLLLIIFRAKYYQHMFETRSRFDNLYVTQELRELDLKRYLEGRETILPLNRREQAKYINVTSFRLVATEKLYLTRSMVFMTITTFKLLIHIIADYSLYWVLMTVRYHGRFQTILPPGPSDAGVQISGNGIVADLIRSIFNSLTVPLVPKIPSPVTCLPNPYPPDLQRYTQIAVLIMLLWFFSLFEPYGLRLRHVIMGHYRPERAKTRAVWLYNHILRTRGSFMKLARRKLHREYKYSDQESLTFRHWINSVLPCWWLRYMLGTLPKEPNCLLCNTLDEGNDSDTKLMSCKTTKCPGMYCTRCYCDIGYLCTICLSPEDYGDMSDISLETGSSDDGSDQESEDDRSRDYKDALNKTDDERKRLLKKFDKFNKSDWRTTRKVGNNQVQGELLLLNDKTYSKIVRSQNTKYQDTLKIKTLFIRGTINKTNVVFKELIDFNICRDFKDYYHNHIDRKPRIVYIIFHKHLSWYYCKKNNKAYEKNFSLDINFRNYDTKMSRRNKLRHDRNRRRNKRCYQLKTFEKIFEIISCLKAVQYSEPLLKFMYRLNVYNIEFTAKFIHITKIKLHSTKLNTFKRRYYRSFKLRNKSKRRSMRQISNNQTIFLTRNKCKSYKNKDNKCNNKHCGMETNTLSNTMGSNKRIRNNKINNNKEEESGGKKISKKEFKNTKQHNIITHSSNKVQKMYSLCCSCFKTDNTVSKGILKKFWCCCLEDKTNFKRRKKPTIKNKTEKFNINRIAKEEKVNTRNYRLSSYLSDQSWFRPKICKDPDNVRMKNADVPCNLDKAAVKETHLLNVFKKGIKKKVKKYCGPSDVCISEQNFNENDKSNLATESPEERRLKFYISLGNQDFEPIAKIHKAVFACSEDRNKKKLSTDSTITSNVASSSKTKTSTIGYSWNFNKEWVSTTLKSMIIKDIKLAITERFLHLRMKNPFPTMMDLYSTLLEASSKVMNGKNEEKQKKTDEKSVTVLPLVKSCSCQYMDLKPTCEDCATQINEKHNEYTVQRVIPKHVRDAEVEVLTHTRSCATQYRKISDKTCSCIRVDKDTKLTKEFGDSANIGEYSSDLTESSLTLSTISLNEDIKTDTTVCSRVAAIDYEVSPRRVKPKKNVRKLKVEVITKANQGTATDKAKLCDVSTITSDWWSPLVERKLGKVHLSRGEMYESRQQRNKLYSDRSISTNGRIVTFESRAQIISPDKGDNNILSPSRYLLESQKYYNELFSPNCKPCVYSVNAKNTEDFEKHWSPRDNTRKGKTRKTKRLNKRSSPHLKISKSNIDKIRDFLL